ncbi:hypothetical protein [Pusillimonas sp.]|uniref:hypothetical protein n=1 Tax=Pusillimonas sp. TaxID=3040095 RepID=UPI0037CB7B85
MQFKKEPFFFTEEIAVEMVAAGYESELPPIACTMRLRDVLTDMSDAELALIADQERERRQNKQFSVS